MTISIAAIVAILSYAIALCGILPLFPWLTTLPRLLLIGGLIAALWQNRREAWLLKNWLLNLSVVPLFLYYAIQFSHSNAVQPVISMLAIMLTVRLVGEKTGRHYLQMYVLSLFCLASSSLFDLSPIFLVYLGLLLFLIALSLVLLTFHAHDSRMVLGRSDMRRVLVVGLLMPLISVPLLVFFFPILPRTQIPLWNFIAAPVSRSSGFSDKVEPGGSSSIGESAVPAFRAEMPRQPRQQLYWRGVVFNQLVGNRWVRDSVPAENIVIGTQRISQTIYTEPGSSRFLIALDVPADVGLFRSRRYPDAVFEMPAVSGRRQSYSVESSPSGVLPVATKINRAFYVRLPDTIPARFRDLGGEISRRGTNDVERVKLLENYFRNGNFRYSLQGLPTGDHAIEQFMFETRQGHCEFFASAFAILARAAGIPTRLVGGYFGGEYNELGGYYLINEQMAHVWVEIFLTGKGWLRIDPSSFAVNAGGVWSEPRQRSLGMRLRLAIDSLDHAWNRSVITYDFERQVSVARSTGRRLQELSWKQVAMSAVKPAILIGIITAIWVLTINRRRVFISAEERLLRRFYRRLKQDTGITVNKGTSPGLFELAAATGNQRVREFAEIYAGAIYRDRALNAIELDKLQKIVRKGFQESFLDSSC